MTLEQTELTEIIDALKMNQERALELMASTGAEVFGLSFNDNGSVKWQFMVSKVFGKNALVDTYSWIDGGFYSTELVSVEYLKNNCALYLDEKRWLADATNLGAIER